MHDNQAEAGRLVDMDRHIQQTNDRLQCIKQVRPQPTTGKLSYGCQEQVFLV